jgi:hypothetical protein
MSPPPAPMFMPHGASLDVSSDELQSPSAAQGPLDDTATPVSARRYASLFSCAARARELNSEWKRLQKQCKWQRRGRRGRAFSNGPLMTRNMASYRRTPCALHLRFYVDGYA